MKPSLLILLLLFTLGLSVACQKGQPDKVPASTKGESSQGDPRVAELLSSLDIFQFKESMEAPEFELLDLTGEKVNIRQYEGKVVLLSFWATW